jgi:hypothetical protein
MPTLNADDMADHVYATQNDLGVGKWVQIAQPIQRYEIMKHIAKDDKIVMSDGRGIQRNVMVTLSNHARSIGMFQTITRNTANLLDQLRVPWRRAHSYWQYDYVETLENRGRSLITNIIEPRMANAWLSMAEHLENVGWSAPASTNTADPYGVPHYVVQNASEGFNGGNPSGYSACAGIDASTVTEWRNWPGTYTNVRKDDLIRSMKRGHRQCHWETPVTSKEMEMAYDLRIYTTESVVQDMEDVGEGQNENLGRDIASMQAGSGGRGGRDVRFVNDQIAFRRHPIIWVPELDELTSNNPVYMLDLGTFAMYCLKGDYMRVSKPKNSREQPDIWSVDIMLSYNFLMLNRRRNAVWYAV